MLESKSPDYFPGLATISPRSFLKEHEKGWGRALANSQDSVDRGHFRVLMVLETVADHGPITLDRVSDLTGIPRTAAFRALKGLEEREWVRAQMGTGAYAVTAGFVARLRRANKTYEEIDTLLPLLRQIAKDEKVHFDIAVLEEISVPRVVESTRRKRIDDPTDFFDSPFSLVSLCAEDPRMRMMVLRSVMDSANEEQQDAIRSGELNARIRSIGTHGYGKDPIHKGLIIPLNGFGSFAGAMRITSSLANQPRMAVVEAVADTLQNGKFPAIPARTSVQSVNN